MKVEMIEMYGSKTSSSQTDILEVKQEHVEQYKSFYKSFAEANLENMIQDKSLLKLMQLRLKYQISKLTDRIKLYSNKLSISRNISQVKEVLIRQEVCVNNDEINLRTNLISSIILDKDTNAFWRSKVKELVKERELNKNYLKVLNRFHQTLKRSIYDLEKDIFMKQEENKLNG